MKPYTRLVGCTLVATLITDPTVEPVTIAMVKAHTVVEATADDALLTIYLAAARAYGENHTRRQFVQATWELALPGFPATSSWKIELPRPPLLSVESVKYLDTAGIEQTLTENADFIVVKPEKMPAYILPYPGASWPTDVDTAWPNAVKVRYVAGWPVVDGVAAVPESIQNWLMVRVAMAYAFREPVINGTVHELPRNFVDGLLDEWIVPEGA